MSYTRLNPDISELSLLGGKLVLKKYGKVVQAYFRGYNHGTFTETVTVETLPAGWRPLVTVYFLNDLDKSQALIGINGEVKLNVYWSGRNVWASCTYLTA